MRLKLKTLEGDKTGFGTIKGNQGTVEPAPAGPRFIEDALKA